MDNLHCKLEQLKKYFVELESVVIGFSGGVDSTFMLQVACEVLPPEKLLAVTAVSAFFPQREMIEAKNFCTERKINHLFMPVDVLKIAGVRQNPNNRCYLCKKNLFTQIKNVAKDNGIRWVCEGSNMDDIGDYRPGMQAITELGIKSPLRHANLSKQEIRNLSQEMNLPTWNKPSFACLASRFVYGEQITEEGLAMVDKAEQLLSNLEFRQFRVRIHGKMARIEIEPSDFTRIIQPEIREKIIKEFTDFGFSYVSLDLNGYCMGSMNKTILEAGK